MCEIGNLIDLTGWDEVKKDEVPIDETEHNADDTTSFKGPYDPFDSVEKEACIKATNLETQGANLFTETTTKDLHPDLINESPPIGMQAKVDGESEGVATRQRNAINSNNNNNSFQKHLLKLKAAIGVSTPQNGQSGRKSHFEKTILADDMQMLAAESPLKLIEDDPIDTLSRAKFEADLQLMRISSFDSDPSKIAAEKPTTHCPLTPVDAPPLQGREQGEKKMKVNKILEDLKNLVNEKLEKHLRQDFNILLESLTAEISCGHNLMDNQSDTKKNSNNTGLRHAYTRQGTFDLDLDLQTQERRTKSLDIVECGAKMQELPDVMTSSSATYDCESNPEDRELVCCIESPTKPSEKKEPKDQYREVREVMDSTLALQINELLERHNLTQAVRGDIHEPSSYAAASGYNQAAKNQRPTVILVVNNPLTESLSSVNSQLPLSCMVNPSQAQTDAANGSMRRRSSSLSIHDKSKHMSDIGQSVINHRQQQQQVENSQNIAPKDSLLKTPLTSNKSQAIAGFRQRRNSFSIASGSTANGGKAVAGPGAKSVLQVSNNNQVKRHIFGPRTTTVGDSTASKSSQGPMKAAHSIPIKRVAPTLKPQNVDSIDTFDDSHYHHSNPMMTPQTGARTGQKIFCTSTPIPPMRQAGQQPRRSSLRPLASSGTAYSTPQVRRASLARKTAGGGGGSG